ncbi:MAG: DedA family protein [archaeon]
MFDIAINTLISTFGYFGIFILMVIESTFIPLPSEIILIPAGYLAYVGHFNFWLVIIIGTIGSIVGSVISYWIGKRLGRAYLLNHSKMFFIKKEKLLKIDDYFKNHGPVTVFISRLVFGARHVISIVSGFADMNFWKFIGWTVLGALIWNTFLTGVGFFIGSQATGIINYYKIGVALLITIIVIVCGIIYMKKRVKI